MRNLPVLDEVIDIPSPSLTIAVSVVNPGAARSSQSKKEDSDADPSDFVTVRASEGAKARGSPPRLSPPNVTCFAAAATAAAAAAAALPLTRRAAFTRGTPRRAAAR